MAQTVLDRLSMRDLVQLLCTELTHDEWFVKAAAFDGFDVLDLGLAWLHMPHPLYLWPARVLLIQGEAGSRVAYVYSTYPDDGPPAVSKIEVELQDHDRTRPDQFGRKGLTRQPIGPRRSSAE
jgi:hypothetical protein